MGVIPGGDKPKPQGSLEPSGLSALARINEDYVRRQTSAGLLLAAQDARNGFLEGLQQSVFDPIKKVLAGLKPKGFEDMAQAFQDGQLSLKNSIALLSPMQDYGAAYMNAVGGFLLFGQNYGTMPFRWPLGDMKGCEPFGDGIRLLDKGLWDISAQIAVSDTALAVGSGCVEWYLRVYKPNGELYSEQLGLEWNQKAHTSPIFSAVVVPEPGYVVKVEIAWIHGSRRVLGGPRNSRLIVRHINTRIGAGGTGAEPSAPIETDRR